MKKEIMLKRMGIMRNRLYIDRNKMGVSEL